MHFSESFNSSIQNIFSHKLRTVLTLFGIGIGVFSLVTMFSLMFGFKKIILDNMSKMGWNNSVIIRASSGDDNNSSRRHRRRFYYIDREAKPLTYADYEMLRKEIKSKHIYGMTENWQKMILNNKEDWVFLRGTNPDFFKSKTYILKSGRLFNRFEETNAEKVCVVGYIFAEKYFSDTDPLGKIITIGVNRYRIVGVLGEDELNKSGMDFNEWERRRELRAVYIPLSTGALYLRTERNVDYIYLQSDDEASFGKMKTDIYQKMLAQHKMSHDFAFDDVGAMLMNITKEVTEKLDVFKKALVTFASISLIVGGIGLFSILLISINERMTEIGIRKSIGATQTDIMFLFLLESVILAVIGALFGIMFSSSAIMLAEKLMKMPLTIPVQGILLGIGFSIVIGIISGLYPALKASKIDPIEAIYYFD
jgi:putative ABC transport system permease protein